VRPYQPRPIRAIGLIRHEGWRLRTYSILASPLANPLRAFRTGIDRVIAQLPEPPVTPARLGVGFLILHHGRGVDYTVIGWWDNENELPIRLVVRDQKRGSRWRRPKAHEAVCVWDLDVIWAERNAYIYTALDAGTRNPAERYALSPSPFLPRGAWRELKLED
jgi:hypothetical protein